MNEVVDLFERGGLIMKVLIVDDSRTMRVLLEQMMRSIGFETWQAGDGCEALECLKKNGVPDLALVDWNMPVMNGLELVKAIRAIPEYVNLQIMMVTTETEMEKVVGAIEAGADEYVMKPFNKDIILDKLKMLGLYS